VAKSLGAVASGALVGGGAYVYHDEGAHRAVTFWSMVLPGYFHYKFVEWKVVPDDRLEIAPVC